MSSFVSRTYMHFAAFSTSRIQFFGKKRGNYFHFPQSQSPLSLSLSLPSDSGIQRTPIRLLRNFRLSTSIEPLIDSFLHLLWEPLRVGKTMQFLFRVKRILCHKVSPLRFSFLSLLGEWLLIR